MNMQVKEFLDMFVDPDGQKFRLWDNNKEEIVFEGYIDDIPYNMEYAEITSIDNIYNDDFGGNELTLNVDIEE